MCTSVSEYLKRYSVLQILRNVLHLAGTPSASRTYSLSTTYPSFHRLRLFGSRSGVRRGRGVGIREGHEGVVSVVTAMANSSPGDSKIRSSSRAKVDHWGFQGEDNRRSRVLTRSGIPTIIFVSHTRLGFIEILRPSRDTANDRSVHW